MSKENLQLLKDAAILLGLVVIGAAIDRLEKSHEITWARLIAVEGRIEHQVKDIRESALREPQDAVPVPRGTSAKPRARKTVAKKAVAGDA
jgi:alkylated DNA nucleotide flippase Atl1